MTQNGIDNSRNFSSMSHMPHTSRYGLSFNDFSALFSRGSPIQRAVGSACKINSKPVQEIRHDVDTVESDCTDGNLSGSEWVSEIQTCD
jgi:hypothetical protein